MTDATRARTATTTTTGTTWTTSARCPATPDVPREANVQPGIDWSKLDDGALVEAYRERAVDAAFAVLVSRYEGRLFRVLVGMVSDVDLAEELCQRTFVKAVFNLDKLRDSQAFYAWLLMVARGTALDEQRQYARRNRDPYEEALVGAENPESSHSVKDAIRTVLGRLSPKDGLAVILADLQQLSVAEIAQAFGTKESAAKMRIKRARERFRSIYQDLT
jgi:RNA polymerase sigma-70 factor (ECF subfamily)